MHARRRCATAAFARASRSLACVASSRGGGWATTTTTTTREMCATSTMRGAGDAPTLKANMTALVRLVHPDVLAATHPELSRVNADALAHVQGTLDGVQKSKQLPGAKVRRLRFYVRDADGASGVREVPFVLRTTGGDCRNVVARDLGSLFAAVGIERRFTWGEMDWSTTRTDEEVEEERRRRRDHGETSRSSASVEDEDAVPHAYRDPMPSNPSMRKKQTMDVHQALKQLDSAFEAIAACAWLTEEDAERKRIVQFEVIPHLVSQGWVLKGDTIEAIWRGERDETTLLDGLDGGSSLAVLAVLRHAKNFERMYGAPP